MRNEALPLGELRDAVIQQLGLSSRRASTEARRLEFDTVLAGREAGWSWARLGGLLQEPGETLRRRHAERVIERLRDRDTPPTRR